MNKIRKVMDKISEWMAIGILGIMTVLVTWQVITLYLPFP